MSHIYIYSPSSAVRDRAAFARGVKRLRGLGHEVELDPSALARDTRFAGNDETRLAGIHRAAASGADWVLISRGGYGLTRLLPHMDYAAIAKSIERGTQWMGVSDFTALQMALLASTKSPTWAGCDVEADWGRGDPDMNNEPNDIMQACFNDVTNGSAEGTGWRLKAADVKRLASAGFADDWQMDKAMLWGGNLAMLSALLGTPYFPKISTGVLFVEDVGEHPYRIERMLEQLLHAGVLAKQRAIVLGQFSGYTLAPHDKGFKFDSVVQRLQTLLTQNKLHIPVFTGLPYGHVPTKVCLPVGHKITLLRQGADVLLLW